MRRLARFTPVLAALALAPAAAAAGPSPGIAQGREGLSASGIRYTAVAGGAGRTVLRAGTRSATLAGRWGIPLVTFNGVAGGLSHDRSTLVLADATPQQGALRAESRFALVDARSLRLLKTVRLPGDFAFDALAPSGRTLYLIHHVDREDLSRYVVKAYDVPGGRLFSEPIADKTQLGWTMGGYPVARADSADGRWAYTLYQRSGGMPFVHALDTVSRTARCIGLPWPYARSQAPLATAVLRVAGPKLEVASRGGTRMFAIDTTTFDVTKG
jgi:hypothetical protein